MFDIEKRVKMILELINYFRREKKEEINSLMQENKELIFKNMACPPEDDVSYLGELMTKMEGKFQIDASYLFDFIYRGELLGRINFFTKVIYVRDIEKRAVMYTTEELNDIDILLNRLHLRGYKIVYE